MILQALTAYYEELLRQGKTAAPGWDEAFNVSFGLEIGDNGELVSLIDLREMQLRGKKQVLLPKQMRVPFHVKRSSGVAANFLCDNSSYILGADEKGKPERSKQCFEACADLHHKLLEKVDTPAAKAVLSFFDHWNPEKASEHSLLKGQWKDLTGNSNFVFYYDYEDGRRPVTEDADFQEVWQKYYQSSNSESENAQCLVTGKVAPIALVHPSIKGVQGAQSSGAALVSFNAPAFCSYGREQGANAPVSDYAAFAYTTALNMLLADRNHCRYIGDTAVVCWAENANDAYAELEMGAIFGLPEDSGVQDKDLTDALKRLTEGKSVSWKEEILLPDQHFYFLGLSPNAARISIRFFLQDTFGEFAKRIQEHERALEIVRPAFDKREYLSVWALARETVNLKERNPSPVPQLAGDLLRAVLTGGQYPATLINGVTARIRAEREITRGRAAIIKAYYIRHPFHPIPEEVLTVSVNEETKNQPYVLGRLFAVLEAVQDVANPGINTTIRDRYFSSACATPGVVFPTLLKLAQKHLQKLDDRKYTYYDKQITNLIGKLPPELPMRLSLPEQGSFEIGYYHQVQERYEKKNKEE